MTPSQVLLLAFVLGVLSGLRALTPVAAAAWGAHLGWIALRSPFTWLGSLPAAVIFAVLALAELVNDKLAKTPPRTAPPSLVIRMVMGAFVGACVSTAGGETLTLGAICGVLGALAGTFGGYQIRARLVKALHSPDLVIALLEDAIAIGASLWVVSRF
jgi:uncharacterized membrane protein